MIPWQIDYAEGVPRVHIEVRSMSPWQVQRYLLKLGGCVVQEESYIVGRGWEACLEKSEPVGIGSLRIGVVQLDIYGLEEELKRLMKSLSLWLVRGGG
ncbi:MAG: DUF1952 domain-containing protein [Chloroflexi bacterium]|nr:DUF1952 domain-containing protein [Chloroflexota bacterium]